MSFDIKRMRERIKRSNCDEKISKVQSNDAWNVTQGKEQYHIAPCCPFVLIYGTPPK